MCMYIDTTVDTITASKNPGHHALANKYIIMVCYYHAGYNTNGRKIYKNSFLFWLLLCLYSYLYFPTKVGIKSCRLL